MVHSSHDPISRRIALVLLTTVALWTCTGEAPAGVIYVNSRTGDNRLNGRAPEPTNAVDGPVRTLQRALQLVRRGDTVSLVNNGIPYYGCFTLVGERVSGTPITPFRIMGNGVVLSGSKPILPDTWTPVGVDLWKITPFRKGHALLLRADTPVPEIPCPEDAETLPELPDGHWCLFQGAIYYKSLSIEIPSDLPFSLADDEVGLTLLDVHHVEIHDLVVRHYRLDGINIHDRCYHVTISNVTCEQNGRAGVTIAGSCTATLLDVTVRDNREHSVLLTELGEATIVGGEITPEPTSLRAVPAE